MKRIGIDLLLIGKKYGGAGRYGINLINELQKIDKKNKYFIFVNKSIENKIRILNNNFSNVIIPIPFNIRILRIIYEQLFLKFAVRKLDLDAMHFISNIIPLINKIDKKVSVILTVHDLIFLINPSRYPIFKYWYYKIFVVRSISIADKIITVSESTKKNAQSFTHDKIKTIDQAADGSFKFLNLKKDNFILVFSTIEPGKNIEFIIKTVNRYRIRIIGRLGWKYKKFITLIKKKKNIEYSGYVDDHQLVNLINRARLVIFPSKAEGFGLPIIESLACGTPVIANDIPVFKEIYKDNIFYFTYPDEKELMEKIDHIYSLNSKQYSRIQKKCLNYSKRFSWLKTAEETVKVYK